ncbi:MAG TPA: CNNM domain-containing protein [Planctomycetota bacterium]
MATILIYLCLAVILLALNAFFVLAEFAAIKMRGSRVEQLVSEGHPGAKLVQHIQANLDEYLAVCQVGITFASIGLGATAEPAFASLVERLTGATSRVAHGFATAFAVILASSLHVVLGEQVPKLLAIHRPQVSALWIARPLQVFRLVLYVPLKVLSAATRVCLRPFGIRGESKEVDHSEEELRIILAKSQTAGLMSFRRLLLLENIFDLSELKVRDAMRSRDAAKTLRLSAAWEESLKIVRDSKLSRFPLVDDAGQPIGVIHVKDLFYAGGQPDLRKIARPFVTALEDAPLEALLGELQKSRVHLAIVKNADGKWTGVISLEDIVEEITGTIEDEFETEPQIHLSDALSAGRVVLDVEADSLEEAIGQAFGRIEQSDLPLPKEKIVPAVLDRERAMSTYLGNALAVPHARLEGLEKPAIVFARSTPGIPVKGREDKAHLLFILLTPAGQPRMQVRLLARVAAIIGSEYVGERLRQADSKAAVVEVVRAAEQVTLS